MRLRWLRRFMKWNARLWERIGDVIVEWYAQD